MNKNVHFVQTNEYYNDEFRIYDISYLSNDIILSTDLIGQLNYYKISDNLITKNETKEIYSQSDLDNLISLFSLDVISQNTSPEIIIGSSSGEVVYLKDDNISHKFTNNKSSEFSKVKFIDENIFSAGDTKGNLTIFDIRQKKAIKIFSEQSEEITDILYDNNKPDFLLSSSIDSTLSVYDLKKHSLYALSDKLDEELNCLLSVKGCNHILCGSGEGNILIFNWNWFGDFKDQIRGHPEGINTMDKYNDNVIFTGCEDGGVRICSMYPKGLRGILTSENNKKKSNFKDVNKIKISSDKNSLITCSGMDCLRLYNISGLDFEKIYKSKDGFDDEEEEAPNSNSDNDNDNDNENNNSEKEENEIDDDEKIKKLKEKAKKEKFEENDINVEDIEDFEDEEEEEDDEEYGEEEEDDFGDDDEEEEKEEKEEGDKVKNKGEEKDVKFINKKRKKESDDDDDDNDDSDEENDKENDSDDSDEDDSSSSQKKRKTKKVKKLDKNKKTKSIIDKEERKAFFNDL
jgi:hypothetical protein